MDCWSKEKVAQSKEENWAFEDFKSEHRKTIVEVCWTRKTFKKIEFIDPILNWKDHNEYQRYIRNDVRVERNHINIEYIVRVPKSKAELCWLQLFIQLNLKRVRSGLFWIFTLTHYAAENLSKLNKVCHYLNESTDGDQRCNLHN